MRNKFKYPNVFSREELTKLVDIIDKPKIMVAVVLTYFCGLRISETVNLEVKDVCFESRRIKVVSGKFNKDRYVPLNPGLVPILRKWIDMIGDEKYLFPSKQKPQTHLHKKTLFREYDKFLKKVNLSIPRVRDSKGNMRNKYAFHTLRHTRATHLWEKTGDIYLVSKFLGHNQVETTQIYTHISDTELHNRVDQADRMPYVTNYSKAYQKEEKPKESIPELEMMRLEIERLKEKNKQLELMRQIRPMEVESTLSY